MCRPVSCKRRKARGAAVSRGAAALRCRPPPRLGPQVRWAAGRPGSALGAALAAARPRLPPPPCAPGRCSPRRLALRRLRKPARRRTSPPGLVCPFAGLRREGGLADRRARGERRLGARVPAASQAPLPPLSGPGARSPCGRRGALGGGAVRAPPPAPRPRRPHPDWLVRAAGPPASRRRCGASVHSRPAPGLEGPGPGGALSEGRAIAPRRPTCRPGRAGRGFWS